MIKIFFYTLVACFLSSCESKSSFPKSVALGQELEIVNGKLVVAELRSSSNDCSIIISGEGDDLLKIERESNSGLIKSIQIVIVDRDGVPNAYFLNNERRLEMVTK